MYTKEQIVKLCNDDLELYERDIKPLYMQHAPDDETHQKILNIIKDYVLEE